MAHQSASTARARLLPCRPGAQTSLRSALIVILASSACAASPRAIRRPDHQPPHRALSNDRSDHLGMGQGRDGGFRRRTDACTLPCQKPVQRRGARDADIPSDIDVGFVDEYDEHASPIGARGIGELGGTGVAAAVANALYDAIGVRVREVPILPHHILDGWRKWSMQPDRRTRTPSTRSISRSSVSWPLADACFDALIAHSMAAVVATPSEIPSGHAGDRVGRSCLVHRRGRPRQLRPVAEDLIVPLLTAPAGASSFSLPNMPLSCERFVAPAPQPSRVAHSAVRRVAMSAPLAEPGLGSQK